MEVLELMENQGIEPTVRTYKILVDGSSAARDISKVEAMFDDIKRKKIY